MIANIIKEVTEAIEQSFSIIAEKDYTSSILYIGRADIIKGAKQHTGTDCVIDYQLDRYYDETREAFYLRYLNRNYTKEGFHYEGESGIDDLSIEMMIYCHLWDSIYFLKSLYRLASIINMKGYIWKPEIPVYGKHTFIKESIIEPLQNNNMRLSNIVTKAYKSDIRNAFAHSLYNVDIDKKKIHTRTKLGHNIYTFNEFQEIFLYSVILMNKLQNYLEFYHIEACKINNALTAPFYSPEGIKIQVHGEMKEYQNKQDPRFRLIKVK